MSAVIDQQPQHLLALEYANAIRLQRVALKRWVREPTDTWASRERVIEVLLDPPRHAEGMAVFDLLVCARGLGPAKARRILGRARIGERRPVGRLTVRQAAELGGSLRRDAQAPTLWDAVEARTQAPELAGAVRSPTPASTRESS